MLEGRRRVPGAWRKKDEGLIIFIIFVISKQG